MVEPRLKLHSVGDVCSPGFNFITVLLAGGPRRTFQAGLIIMGSFEICCSNTVSGEKRV